MQYNICCDNLTRRSWRGEHEGEPDDTHICLFRYITTKMMFVSLARPYHHYMVQELQSSTRFTNSPLTLTGANHHWIASTNIGGKQWLSLANLALKVAHVGRKLSLVARTNKTLWHMPCVGADMPWWICTVDPHKPIRWPWLAYMATMDMGPVATKATTENKGLATREADMIMVQARKWPRAMLPLHTCHRGAITRAARSSSSLKKHGHGD